MKTMVHAVKPVGCGAGEFKGWQKIWGWWQASVPAACEMSASLTCNALPFASLRATVLVGT